MDLSKRHCAWENTGEPFKRFSFDKSVIISYLNDTKMLWAIKDPIKAKAGVKKVEWVQENNIPLGSVNTSINNLIGNKKYYFRSIKIEHSSSKLKYPTRRLNVGS